MLDLAPMDSTGCVFCAASHPNVLLEHPLAVVRRDGYPVSKGHCLIIPRRHVASLFETTQEERIAIMDLIDKAKTLLDKEHKPDGYNIGINSGVAAGQTVMHLHVHLIPRYNGDLPDPRGGVRWIFPDRARYWE